MYKTKSDIRVYLEPAFLICVVVLATAGAGMSIAMKKLGVILKKEPLPLKKSLELLDERGLGPYKVVSKEKIKDQDTLKALGTEDYIQWVLEDAEFGTDSPVQRLMLFVTYYQLPDKVPHVPEECWTGGGFQKLRGESVTFDVNNVAGFEAKVPGKHLIFALKEADPRQSGVRIPILYFFKVNGQYAGSRSEARIILNKNLFRKSSYFCKVELAFNQMNQMSVVLSDEQVIAASEKLLAVILPILEKEHWPDFEETDRLL